MYEELVKALRETDFGDTCVLCEHEDMCKGNDCIIIQAADAIEELSHENESLAKSVNEASELLQKRKPSWISVEERLPEEVRKSYLCRTDSGYHCEVRWTDNVYGLWTGGGGQWGWSIFDIPQYAKVTHWMPLPSTEGLNET